MKRYLLLFLVINILFGQDKYQFFLTSDENLKLVGDNYDIIKTELDKMLTDYNSKIDLDNYWKEKYSVEVATGSNQINEDTYKYYRDLYKDQMGMEWAATEAKRLATYTPTKTVTKERNRTIERGETLFTKKTEWSDVVSYYGGYSELSKLGISKDDKSKFDISVVLEKIELTGPSNCLAHVKINGDDDALKFHKIPKSTFKYKGTYKIKYDDDYLALYDGGNIRLDLRFDEKKYLPKSKTEFKINLNKSILPSTKNYRNSIIVMFDDLAPESIYIDNSPKFESFRKEYKQAFEMEYQSDLNKLSLEKMKEKLNNFNKMKARQALRESEQLKYKNFQKEYYKQGFKACGVTCAILAIGLINSAVQGY